MMTQNYRVCQTYHPAERMEKNKDIFCLFCNVIQSTNQLLRIYPVDLFPWSWVTKKTETTLKKQKFNASQKRSPHSPTLSKWPSRERDWTSHPDSQACQKKSNYSINQCLQRDSCALWVWDTRRIWKRSGKKDLNRELAAQRAAPPGNKNRDLKERASPSLRLSPPPQGGEWCGWLPESQLGHGQLPGNSPNSFLRAFSHILRTSKVSIFIRDTILNLIRITGRVVRHRQPGWPGEWNTEGKTLRGSDSSLTRATRFLCSPEPMISPRPFPYPQNEAITTHLTGQKKKSMRKESVLPTVIWPVRDNSGWPWHTLLPSLLSLLRKTARHPKLW